MPVPISSNVKSRIVQYVFITYQYLLQTWLQVWWLARDRAVKWLAEFFIAIIVYIPLPSCPRVPGLGNNGQEIWWKLPLPDTETLLIWAAPASPGAWQGQYHVTGHWSIHRYHHQSLHSVLGCLSVQRWYPQKNMPIYWIWSKLYFVCFGMWSIWYYITEQWSYYPVILSCNLVPGWWCNYSL